MGLYAIRIFFIIIASAAGYFYWPENKLLGFFIGLFGSIAVVGVDMLTQKIPFKKLAMAIGGLLIGLMTAILVANFILLVPFATARQEMAVRFVLYFMFSYLGIIIGIRSVGELGFLFPVLHQIKGDFGRVTLLDSSVAIDGRVHELARSGFLEGTVIIPSFIAQELQELADASGEMKRQRGRRGLETLKKLQAEPSVEVKFYDVDYPDIGGVDAKLIKLAAQLDAKVLTNDFNLTKVAEVQDIKVLNLNNLATLMRPKLMSGEILNLKIVKEGKEHGQGVGYLEDGTMIVVEEGGKFVGRTVETVIDSTIQTTSGRIIFAKLK